MALFAAAALRCGVGIGALALLLACGGSSTPLGSASAERGAATISYATIYEGLRASFAGDRRGAVASLGASTFSALRQHLLTVVANDRVVFGDQILTGMRDRLYQSAAYAESLDQTFGTLGALWQATRFDPGVLVSQEQLTADLRATMAARHGSAMALASAGCWSVVRGLCRCFCGSGASDDGGNCYSPWSDGGEIAMMPAGSQRAADGEGHPLLASHPCALNRADSDTLSLSGLSVADSDYAVAQALTPPTMAAD